MRALIFYNDHGRACCCFACVLARLQRRRELVEQRDRIASELQAAEREIVETLR